MFGLFVFFFKCASGSFKKSFENIMYAHFGYSMGIFDLGSG